MKKYILMRVLRSLFSILMVTTLTFTIVFTMVPRRLIFKQDPNYNKMKTPDKKANYENTVFERMGYINYYNSKELQAEASDFDAKAVSKDTKANKKVYQDFIASKGSGWQLKQFETSKEFYAVRDIPIYERVWNFYANLVVIDHPWKVQDETNPDLERYLRFEDDPAIGWSLVGSGTQHKYLLYVNNKFPYVHQNFVTFNLGKSYPTYANTPVLQVITQGQGKTFTQDVTFPTGRTKKSPVDIYSRTYKSPSQMDSRDINNFGKGDAYSATKNNHEDPSMISNSLRIGLVGVLISYLLGLPIAMLMAHFKDGLIDRFATVMTTFMLALPIIALIYVVRYMGSQVGLPDSFPEQGASSVQSYVLPALILGIYGAPTTVVWFRRFLVDQQSSDYVRFARAKGLSELEISKSHLFKNALVPIISGIPAAVVATIAGATLTETIFAFPGMGKMLIDAVRSANNAMVVGLVLIYTVLSIGALLVGDILMTIVDPRIKLSTKGGK